MGADPWRCRFQVWVPAAHHATSPRGQDHGQGDPDVDALIDALQWPAMMVTLAAAWLVASQTRRKRSWGFWCFILSNVLWIVWAWHDGAYALIALQVGLFALNLRGARKNEPAR